MGNPVVGGGALGLGALSDSWSADPQQANGGQPTDGTDYATAGGVVSGRGATMTGAKE
jgi:hypothetical protein